MATEKVDLVLYQNAGSNCPFAQRPMIVLAEKGLEYTLKKVACARGEPKDPELCAKFAALSPGGDAATVTVPLVEHNNGTETLSMIESSVCSEYIEDVWSDRCPLWPKDPRQRQAVRMFMDTAGQSGILMLVFSDATTIGERLTALPPKLKNMNRCLELYGVAGGDFILGKDFSMAEVMNASLVQRVEFWGGIKGIHVLKLIEELGLDRLARWWKAVLARPSVVSTFPMSSEEFKAKQKADGAIFKISYDVVEGALQNVKVEKDLA